MSHLNTSTDLQEFTKVFPEVFTVQNEEKYERVPNTLREYQMIHSFNKFKYSTIIYKILKKNPCDTFGVLLCRDLLSISGINWISPLAMSHFLHLLSLDCSFNPDIKDKILILDTSSVTRKCLWRGLGKRNLLSVGDLGSAWVSGLLGVP